MARLGAPKDVEALARRMRRQGWSVAVRRGSTHLRWARPDGVFVDTALTGDPNVVCRKVRALAVRERVSS